MLVLKHHRFSCSELILSCVWVTRKQRPIKRRPEDPKTLRPQKLENEDPPIFNVFLPFVNI